MSPFFIWETLTMRRKDREVKELSEITRIIDSSDCCRLGLVDKGKAYIVPMNFGYEVIGGEIVLYLHSAREGRKISLIEKEPMVSFEMDGGHSLKKGDTASSCSFFYQSIMGSGRIEILKDKEEKKHGLKRIMEHYTQCSDWDFDDKALEATCVLRLSVMELSAKANKRPIED